MKPETNKRIATSAPACWQREAPCACLRVETSPRESDLFPYHDFVTASLTHSEQVETLRLTFSLHDVEIKGRDLRTLLLALQDFAVKWVRVMPERYHVLELARTVLCQHSHSRGDLDLAKSVCTKHRCAYTPAVNTLLCPHCQTPVSDSTMVCRGCGAEIVRGANRCERSLIGVAFVIAATLVGAVVLHALEIARGAPPLPPPKAEDGFLVLLGLIVIVFVPYILGTRVARLLWRSRIRFYRRYQHQ